MRFLAIALAEFAGATSWAADDTSSAGRNPLQPNTAPAAAPKEAVPPPSVTIIAAADAHGMLGRDVRSPTDEDMGRIVDVIVDRAGLVRAAVVDFGGFLGVGSRKIVVDWNALHFGLVANKSDSITLELTKDQVTAAPEYKEDTPIVVLGRIGQPAAVAIQPLMIRRNNLFARLPRTVDIETSPARARAETVRDVPAGGVGTIR